MTAPCPDAPRPARSRRAPRGWRARFLVALAESSNVRAAAQEARVGLIPLYRAKREDRDFAQHWLLALCEGYDRLELELLARLRSGVGGNGEGRADGEARRHDNATALRLLLAHRDSRARIVAQQDNVTAEDVRASIEEKLARLREQVLEREAAEREAAVRAGGDGA